MSREIEFRAWDKVDGMVYFGLEDLHDNIVNPFHGVYEVPIMQYTGLQDKNGREIYEGDIVHRKYHETNNLAIRKVVFQNDGFKLQETGLFTGLSMLYPSLEFIEVIGNIYANPELIHGT